MTAVVDDKLASLGPVPDDSANRHVPSFLCAWCWRRCPIDRLAQHIGPKRRPRCATCASKIKERKA